MNLRAQDPNRRGIIGHTVQHLDSVDSTNEYLKRAAKSDAPEGLVVVAAQQTMGRGRCGREFQSADGKGLYLSVLLRPTLPLERVLPITALAAVATRRAVARVYGVQPSIKWTNDLVMNGKKLAGILAEMVLDGQSGALCAVVLGIGINVCQTREDFSGDVADIATSLALETGKKGMLSALEVALIAELETMYRHLNGDFTADWQEYRQACITLGKEVRILNAGRERTAWAEDIDAEFALIVRTPDGTRERVSCGEVSVRGLYGYV